MKFYIKLIKILFLMFIIFQLWMKNKQKDWLNMLQKKRENDHLKLRINTNFIIQKNESGNIREES